MSRTWTVFMFAAALCAQAGQGGAASADPLAVLLRQLVDEARGTDKAPASLHSLFVDYAKALGEQPEASLVHQAAALLATAGESWNTLAGATEVASLLREVTGRRGASRPELLLPLLEVLGQAAPDNVCVQFQLAESYGVESLLRDSGRTLSAIGRCEVLLAGGDSAGERRARELLQMLGAGGELLQGAGVVMAWIAAVRCAVEDGDPMRRLEITDLPTLQCIENGRRARALGQQQEWAKALTELAKLRSQDPAGPPLLGQTYASVGPLWNLSLAKSQLQRFLELTSPRTGPAAAAATPVWTASGLRAVLGHVGVGWPKEGVAELRAQVKRAISDFDRGKSPYALLHPDRDDLRKRTDRLEDQVATADTERQRCEAAVDEAQGDYEEAKRRYEAARGGGGAGRNARFQTNLDALYSSVQTARSNLDQRKKKLERVREKCVELAAQRLAHAQRLDSFER